MPDMGDARVGVVTDNGRDMEGLWKDYGRTMRGCKMPQRDRVGGQIDSGWARCGRAFVEAGAGLTSGSGVERICLNICVEITDGLGYIRGMVKTGQMVETGAGHILLLEASAVIPCPSLPRPASPITFATFDTTSALGRESPPMVRCDKSPHCRPVGSVVG